MRRKLTEIIVTKSKPDPKRIKEIWDATLPGFGVRIMPSGARTFFVMYRYAGKQRRMGLGRAFDKELGRARDRATAALRAVERGEDPAQAKVERRRNTVAAVAADYFKERVPKMRNAREVEQLLRRELLGQRPGEDGGWVDGKEPIWRDLPMADITPQEAARLIKDIKNRGGEPAAGQRRRKSGGPWAAHHALEAARAFFNWSVDQHAYGLKASPFDRFKAGALIGAKAPRQRVLADDELRDVWRAAAATVYPYGPLVRALMLTGQRLGDIAGLTWPEVDLDAKLVSIPPARMKMDAAHEVPLAKDMVELLKSLPRPAKDKAKGEFAFSTTDGARPFCAFSKAKGTLDAAIAKLRQADGHGAMPPWVLHDLRRTFRTRLSELRVPDTVAELCIAHQQRGLHRVYDQHSYRDEKRDAMERWAARLAAVIEPKAAGPNLVQAAEVERRRRSRR